jgi:hypothetical protein
VATLFFSATFLGLTALAVPPPTGVAPVTVPAGAAFNFATSVQIKAGSAFFIRRIAPQGGFSWTIPAE